MPFKDPEKRREYARKYERAHRKDRCVYMRNYREVHREELAENKQREVRMWIGDSYIYLGQSGMTRKQRQKFQEELNGEIDRSRPT